MRAHICASPGCSFWQPRPTRAASALRATRSLLSRFTGSFSLDSAQAKVRGSRVVKLVNRAQFDIKITANCAYRSCSLSTSRCPP
ncbi:uncharacterized protein M421DRAFT_149572 [Didymella exigua CBS 183.55]|uniref:Uncharacterized protein n=1 Tax=Didymella exigua CBS 183.55 TaxID=1150837 RepID=A0A6A5RJN7_9PLEO|nr:uncharacterized protein M421DRAFT_149572 [Didymella exigua CBS 183.55]KAF1928575.1 hypothetical protein M421DRAFT_149572 [Didymella exigua CBS 183.55]